MTFFFVALILKILRRNVILSQRFLQKTNINPVIGQYVQELLHLISKKNCCTQKIQN